MDHDDVEILGVGFVLANHHSVFHDIDTIALEGGYLAAEEIIGMGGFSKR